MATSEYSAPHPALGRLREAPIRLSAEAWMVLGLTVAAGVIRVLVIDTQSLWADEALTSYEASLPFGAMLNVVLHVETTPPLYFLFIWAWGHLFGTGVVALRAVSTLAGAAVVPIGYLCGRELASRRAGVIAAALVTVNPFLIWYSQEARAYMLLVALSGMSFLFFLRVRRELSRRSLALWVVWSSVALMTHFFAAFLVAAEAAWLLWVWRTRAVAVAAAAVAVVEAAMLPFALIDTGHGPGWIAAIPRTNRVANAIAEWGVSILFRQVTVASGLLAGAVLVVVVAALTVLAGDGRTRRAVIVGAVIAGAVWVVPLALGFLGPDYFLSRNVMPAVVPLAVMLGACLAAPRARILGGVLTLALLALFAFAAVRVQSRPYLQRPDWRAVVRALGPATVPRAILASDGTTADPLKIYLPGVRWSEPKSRITVIREIDVVGADKALPLRAGGGPLRRRGRTLIYPSGSSVPRSISPTGAHLEARFRVDNWVVGRFVLRRPLSISLSGLSGIAPHFFRRTPVALLIFFQSASGR